MMTKKTYDYTEDSFFLSRRTVMKVGAVVTVALALPVTWLANKIRTRNEHIIARTEGLYNDDLKATIRHSHANANVQRYYEEFGGKPMGDLSYELLHTHYVDRSHYNR